MADEMRDADVPAPRRASVTGRHRMTVDQLPVRRLFVAVLVAGIAHASLAWALLRSMGADEPVTVGLLFTVVTVTVVAALLIAMRARREAFDVATQRAPATFGLLPPMLALGLGLPTIPTVSGGGLEHALLATIPLIAAVTAPGVAIALLLEYSLWTVAARLGEAAALARRASGETATDGERPKPELTPPSLAGRLARLVAGLGISAGLLILSDALVDGEPRTWLARSETWFALAGCVLTMVLAVLAAASAGLSPGRDVDALAERLDAIGWDEAPGSSTSAAVRPLAGPVRVTSFDAVGELFANLERLRARLAEDVGTYQRALDRTHAADAAKREFLAAVSHELRTPLNSILGYAQLLLESELSEDQAEDVRLILAGGGQLRELIEDILDLSMIESGELELRFAECDLVGLVDELVDIHRAQVRGPDVELRAQRTGEIPRVRCDRKRIAQVLTNLLSNAIKFTEQGSVELTVTHDARSGRVSVAVTDTGVGIASDELSTIFEEYRQVGARKRKLRGTGLGLAIARRIAEAHGGSLTAASKLSRGSTFTLRLPIEPPTEDPSP